MLNPRQLIHFQTALRHGNLHRAADELGISQPALSKSIQALEAQLDVKLFVRSARGVEPTPFGKAMSAHGEALVAELLAAEGTAAHFRGGFSRSLRMGAGPTFCNWLLPMAMREFRLRYPTTRVWISVSMRDDLARQLRAGDIDFYIGLANDDDRAGLRQDILYSDRLAVCCRPLHPLNHCGPVDVSELADFEWAFIRSQGRDLAHPELLKVFLENGLGPPKSAVETDSAALVYALVSQSDTLCLRPIPLGHRLESIGGLVELPVPPIFPRLARAITFRDPAGLTGADLAMVRILKEVTSGFETVDDSSEPAIRVVSGQG